MLIKTLLAIATMLYSLGAHAQTPSPAKPGEQAPRNPDQILERLKAASPVAQCAGIATTADGATRYTMADGISYEFAHAEGKVTSVTALIPGGQRMQVDAAPASKAGLDTDKRVRSSILRADIRQAMERLLKTECAKFALREAGEAPAEPGQQDALAAAAPQSDVIMIGNGGVWGFADFLGYSDYVTDHAFESSAVEWERFAEYAGRGNRVLPKCTVVVKECSDFCQNVGQLEYSGCGGLALAAGFTLGPPTGAAVGFYCSGNVYLATEQCKSRCQTPTVVCSWN